ncbi:DUF6220 domain-containing protein [Lacibacterium aquatile]|uniref:DUF6220 domain-containing protein n=1 Tax=Lacibacterium aquatile TaxID=1168082 RepID=A0ABW5DVI5_9PROT
MRALSLLAWSVPLLLLGQFLTVGLATFHDAALWGAHIALGSTIGLPVLILAILPWLMPQARPVRWWTLALLTIFLIQIGLAGAAESGLTLLAALHPVNAIVLMGTAVIVAMKLYRRERKARNIDLNTVLKISS